MEEEALTLEYKKRKREFKTPLLSRIELQYTKKKNEYYTTVFVATHPSPFVYF